MGYSRIDHCKTVLLKNFTENIDYKIDTKFSQIGYKKLASEVAEASFSDDIANKKVAPEISGASLEAKNHGGHNKETILMTIDCFKELCLESRTDKANQIRKYYIKLENVVNEVVKEQAQELQLKLTNQAQEFQIALDNKEKEAFTKAEEMLIDNLKDKKLVYIGYIEDTVAKFGFSKGIDRRVLQDHKKEIGPNFVLRYAIITDHYVSLEEFIKKECNNRNSVLFGRRISKVYNGKKQTELIRLDTNFTIEDLYNEFLSLKDIHTGELYKKIIEENAKLKNAAFKVEYEQKEEEKEQVEEKQEEFIKSVISPNGVKCVTCCRYITDTALIKINKITNQPYTQCVECMDKAKDERFKKTEPQRMAKIKKEEEELARLREERIKLLNSTVVYKCFQCKKDKTPIELGIRRNNTLFKICTNCRGVDIEDPNDERPICPTCNKKFDAEYNKLSGTNYKTCRDCRKEDIELRNKNKESLESNATTEIVKCKKCNKDMPKILNAKRDGFYKHCENCRGKSKPYDKQKTEVHKESISEQKKVYYRKNKGPIREKQKVYYDSNRDGNISLQSSYYQ